MTFNEGLKKIKKHVNNYMYLHFNVNLMIGRFSLNNYRLLKIDLKKLERQAHESKISFPVTTLYPCYEDKADNAGSFSKTHYSHQDLYVAQRVYENNPVKHVDIGSRIDGFVAHIATFRIIEVLDIRPLEEKIRNIIFKQADIMSNVDIKADYTDSISCLHALEHFGLGRYGDEICYEGFLMGFKNITKMLQKNGRFYFSVPLGKQRIEFHAHRVFSLKYLLELVFSDYEIDRFSYIDDKNELHANISLPIADIEQNCGCHFGCAIFELIKK